MCGGGLSGIELSAELCERWPGLPVTLLSAGELGPGLSQRARAYLRRFFAQRGALLREGTRVERVERDGVWVQEGPEAAIGGGRRIAAEVVVWAGGFVSSDLPRRAGLDVNLREQVRVDFKNSPEFQARVAAIVAQGCLQ